MKRLIAIFFLIISTSCVYSLQEQEKYKELVDFVSSLKNSDDLIKQLNNEELINTSKILERFNKESKKEYQQSLFGLLNKYDYYYKSLYEEELDKNSKWMIVITYSISEKSFKNLKKIEETDLDKNPEIDELNIYFTFTLMNNKYFFEHISVSQHFPFKTVGLNF